MTINVGEGPEKSAPVITEASGVQNPTNTTVAELSGSAEGDSSMETTWNMSGALLISRRAEMRSWPMRISRMP